MPRRVGHDVLAPLGREEPVGDVDRDPLLALGLQAVDEQRKIERLALRAELARVALQRLHLIVEDPASVVEQTSDQRRLAIVHTATGDESQRRCGQK